jgi:hypothetical protein
LTCGKEPPSRRLSKGEGETQRQGSDQAILRTTEVRLGPFSRVTLGSHELAKSRKLKPKTAAWSPKAGLTFRNAIAAVRREIRDHRISFMSRPRRDRGDIPRHIRDDMQKPFAHAA